MENKVLAALSLYTAVPETELPDLYSSTNRVNRVGDRLEYFMKDLLCDSFDVTDKDEKEAKHKTVLSWTGAKNHPPDIMIRGGEAMEVKKKASKSGSIQLNSSQPHQTLRANEERINADCRTCEDDIGGWSEKDLIYTICRVPSGTQEIDFIWLVYGDCWCASTDVYSTVDSVVSDKIEVVPAELDYGELNLDTNEIGRLNHVDPQGRTKLRLRGMWILDHPADYFSQYVEGYDEMIDSGSPMFLVMRKSKFDCISKTDKDEIDSNPHISKSNITVADPDAVDEVIDCVLLVAEKPTISD
jgi:hypothetical protein